MKKKKLFLLLGCCYVLSGCAAGELTFEEKCTAVYKWFTALHKDNDYIFTLRNVKDKKALREIIFDFCSTNDFEFIIEKEEHFSEDHEKRLDKAFLLTQPQIKVFIFHHKTLDAALFYILTTKLNTAIRTTQTTILIIFSLSALCIPLS